jgi:hypothetical protein
MRITLAGAMPVPPHSRENQRTNDKERPAAGNAHMEGILEDADAPRLTHP